MLRYIATIILVAPGFLVSAQKKITNVYFSWGYNRDIYFAPISIHIKQPGLGNDYYFKNVHGHDKKEVNKVFQHPLTIPQYCVRLGAFIDDKYIIELNFDHTKFVVDESKQLRIVGTLNEQHVDTTVANDSIILTYQLNNGANFFLFNVGKKWNWKSFWKERLTLQPIVKAGIGFTYPHVENTILGRKNAPHFQFGGLNAGIEGDLRINFFKYFYIEPGIKLDYAYYWGLKIAEGKASHSLYTFEYMIQFGINIPVGKRG